MATGRNPLRRQRLDRLRNCRITTAILAAVKAPNRTKGLARLPPGFGVDPSTVQRICFQLDNIVERLVPRRSRIVAEWPAGHQNTLVIRYLGRETVFLRDQGARVTPPRRGPLHVARERPAARMGRRGTGLDQGRRPFSPRDEQSSDFGVQRRARHKKEDPRRRGRRRCCRRAGFCRGAYQIECALGIDR